MAIYHLRFLSNSFTYVDAMIVDTPIFDSDDRGKIQNTMQIKGRLERATIFREYLDKQWQISKLRTNYFNWPNFSNDLKNDIDKIDGIIHKDY